MFFRIIRDHCKLNVIYFSRSEFLNANRFMSHVYPSKPISRGGQAIGLIITTTSALKAISYHRIDKLNMSIGVCLTPLIIIVKTIGPNMSSATVDTNASTIPRLKQGSRCAPVIRSTLSIKSRSLANSKSVRDLMQSGAFAHVRSVGAEAETAIEVGIGCRDARNVGDANGLGGSTQTVVSRCCEAHGTLNAAVGIGLVG